MSKSYLNIFHSKRNEDFLKKIRDNKQLYENPTLFNDYMGRKMHDYNKNPSVMVHPSNLKMTKNI